MAQKYELGEEVMFMWGTAHKGKIVGYTESFIDANTIKKLYKIDSKGECFDVEETGVYRDRIDFVNHVLDSYCIGKDLRFRPVCEKCIRLKGKLNS